jgi:RNA:NAD 2'-phosphotransferase (TPT1/KptA family)
MSHHHEHNHHHHSHDQNTEMSMEEKLAKLLSHWLQHNEEHAKSYEQWAQRAASHGLAEVGSLIEKAAEKTRAADEDFKAAIVALKS